MDLIRSYWKNKPFELILFLAVITRVLAAVFSKGYGMHDDHFLVIETAQSWLDHADYNNWLKERETKDLPTILNFAYAGIHYLLFWLLESLRIVDPQWKMFFVRVIHGAFSLFAVTLGYRITNKISGPDAARLAGLLLAIYWFMPFMAVRNLVEVVCIPFLMWGLWYTLAAGERKRVLLHYFLAGIFFGIAFSIRFQTVIFGGMVGLVILARKEWLASLAMIAGFIAPVLLLHGVPDLIIWGFPFAEIKAYVTHNLEHRYDYSVSPWYTYLLMLIGVLILPVSLFLFLGFFRAWKKHLILFLPVAAFIVFHSIFPNKQERFLIPVIPFFIIIGITGWKDFLRGHPSLYITPGWLRGSWTFFWVLNSVLLVFFTFMYSKKARVESMYYLYDKQPVEAIVIEESVRDHATMMPLFYSGGWPVVYAVSGTRPPGELKEELDKQDRPVPEYVFFVNEKNLDERINRMEEILPGLQKERVIEPGMLDKLLHWLNPVNANQVVHVYSNPAVKENH